MAVSVEAASASILGRTIRYVRGGTGSEPFVFIHGFGADHTTWMFTLPAFAERGRVLALDLPGHGSSDVDVGAGTVPFLADVVSAWLDENGAYRVHLVGHSLGGVIAAELAARQAGRILTLTLIAPPGLGRPINRDFVERLPHLRNTEETREILSLLVANPRVIGRQMVDDVLNYVRRPGVGAALETIARASFTEDGTFPLRDRLASLAQPLQLIWGLEDRVLTPPATADVPSVELIAKAGHLVHMEAAAKVNRLIAALTARPDAP